MRGRRGVRIQSLVTSPRAHRRRSRIHTSPAFSVLGRRFPAASAIIATLALILSLSAPQMLAAAYATRGAPAHASVPAAPEPPRGALEGSGGSQVTPPAPLSAVTRGPASAGPPGEAVPLLTAKAAFAVDLTSNAELFADNADTPLPPASTTKLITALVVVQNAGLDETVQIQAGDQVDPAVYSHMGLEAGDEVTVRDLLAGLLIPSGDDAALALARYVGAKLPGDPATPPRDRFMAAMNRLATSLGMKNTHFVNPYGMDAPGHVSTARDLAIATRAFFQNQTLEQLVDQRVMTVQVGGPRARAITLYSTNQMLGEPGVLGVKTGTTDAAGQCLVLAVSRQTDRIVIVVLGSTDRYADARAILAYLDAQYRWVLLGRGGDLPGLQSALVAQGLSMMTNRTVLLTAQQAAELRYSIKPLPGSGSGPWQPAAEVVFYVGADELLRLPAYTGQTPGTASP